jgi:hypothetical protein
MQWASTRIKSVSALLLVFLPFMCVRVCVYVFLFFECHSSFAGTATC